MPIHGVLIERNQEVDSVAEAVNWLRTGADRQECMSAPDDRLIGIVGVQVQAAPRKDPGEDVARRGDTLTAAPPIPTVKDCLMRIPLPAEDQCA